MPEKVHTQFVVLSNFEGVLGREASGRRWLGITIRARSEDELVSILGTTKKEFYRRYTEALKKRGGRAAAYLETIELEDFDTRRVPETRHRDMHVNISPLEVLRRLILKLICSDNHHDIGPDVLCWRSARQQIINNAGFTKDNGGEEEQVLVSLGNMPPRRLLGLFRDAMSLEGFVQLSHEDRNVKLPFEDTSTVKANTVWYRRDLIEWHSSERPRLNETAIIALLRQTLQARRQSRKDKFDINTHEEARSNRDLH